MHHVAFSYSSSVLTLNCLLAYTIFCARLNTHTYPVIYRCHLHQVVKKHTKNSIGWLFKAPQPECGVPLDILLVAAFDAAGEG